MAMGWLTLDGSIPARKVKSICLPDSEEWEAQFLGAFLSLTEKANWEEHGALSAEEMSDEWRAIFLEFVSGGCSVIPVGTILAYGGDTAPWGFLMCGDDIEVSRVTYANLFAVIGESFGSGDGETTFNLPPSGRFISGRSALYADINEVGDFGGQREVTLEVSEIPSHTHVQDAHNHGQEQHNHVQNAHSHTQNSHNHTQNAHSHAATFAALAASGSGQFIIQTAVAGSQAVANATPTNIAAIATNQNTTPINQAFTAVNEEATAVNQASGGNGAHNNMPPFFVANFIIKF